MIGCVPWGSCPSSVVLIFELVVFSYIVLVFVMLCYLQNQANLFRYEEPFHITVFAGCLL